MDFLRVFSNYLPAESDSGTKILNIKCLYLLLGN